MKIHQTLGLIPGAIDPGRTTMEKTAREATVSFGETLGRAMQDVNSLQQEAGKAVNQMIVGQEVDLHDVMVAVEKAKTSFDLLMEIRNKTIDAYRELMRIQV